MRHVLLAAVLGTMLAALPAARVEAQAAAEMESPTPPAPPLDVPPPPDVPVLAPAPQALPPPPPSVYAAPSIGAEAAMDGALASRVLALLSHQNDTYGMTRTLAGVFSLAGAGVLLAVGTLQFDSSSADTAPLFWTSIGMAPILIAAGIAALTLTMPQEDRYERFKLSFADGMSQLEYTALSGELLAESNLAHSQRMFGGAILLGMAGTGAVYLAAVSQLLSSSGSVDESLAIIAYATPITLLVGGLVGALFSFLVESQPEKDWHALEAGVPPDSLSLNLEVAPYVTASGGGVALAGQF